jgi:hypothetical protein
MKFQLDDVDKLLASARPQGSDTGGENIDRLYDAERRHILKTLVKTRGVLGGAMGAARRLGVPRSTLQYRIKRLGIRPDDYLGGRRTARGEGNPAKRPGYAHQLTNQDPAGRGTPSTFLNTK